MGSQQQQQAPRPRRAGDHDLSIAEMTRIMDVASTLRRERAVAERELSHADTKRMLRERLLETARVTGDPVTAAEIDTAIEHYFETLHEFEPAEPGFESFLAHLYVNRGKIAVLLGFLGAVGAAAALFASALGLGVMPDRLGRTRGRW